MKLGPKAFRYRGNWWRNLGCIILNLYEGTLHNIVSLKGATEACNAGTSISGQVRRTLCSLGTKQILQTSWTSLRHVQKGPKLASPDRWCCVSAPAHKSKLVGARASRSPRKTFKTRGKKRQTVRNTKTLSDCKHEFITSWSVYDFPKD